MYSARERASRQRLATAMAAGGSATRASERAVRTCVHSLEEYAHR